MKDIKHANGANKPSLSISSYALGLELFELKLGTLLNKMHAR